MSQFEVVAAVGAELGEGPLWHEQRQKLYWVNINRGMLYEYDRCTQTHRHIYQGEPIGGYTFQEDGPFLLFQVNEIATLDLEGNRTVMRRNIDPAMRRFNDVIADPLGRVFAGTIGDTTQSGGLHLIDRDGSIHCLFRGTGCANGMGFSPDLKTFYWTDSTARKIFRFNYHIETAELSDRETFFSVPEGEGTPDGMTVDTLGNVWSARWAGAKVCKIDSNGREIGHWPLPAANITSVTFGGREMNELYITSAGGKNAHGLEGALFRLKTASTGRPAFRSKICFQT